MKDRVERTRQWLGRNKIFFETFAAAMLGVMAVFVSVQANRIASIQAEIAERQALAAEVQVAPFLHARVSLRRDPTTDFVEDDELEVLNLGGPLGDFRVRSFVMLRVLFRTPGGRMTLTDSTTVALGGYYFTVAHANASTGLLATLAKVGNNRQVFELERSLWQVPDAPVSSAELRVMRYLDVTYTDRLGRDHRDFLGIDALGSRELDSAEGQRLLDMHRQLTRSGLYFDLDQDSREDLLALLRDAG